MPQFTTSAAPQTEIHYQDLGAGRPVVLIHGWPLSGRMWEKQVTALTAAGFRCIAYDRRGFGGSGQPTGGYDYDTFASDLNDLLVHLDLADAVIAGFSMGGGEVARWFGRYGGPRVGAAMLLGAVPPFLLETADNPGGVDKSVFDGMIAAVKDDRLAFLDGFFPNFYNADALALPADLIAFSKWMAWPASPLATAACIVAFGDTDFRPDLKKIAVPTLVVHGDADRIVPLDVSARRSAQAIAGARLEVIPAAPHGFAATHAAELNRLMLDFLEG